MSVRELCTLALKSGSIDTRFPRDEELITGNEVHRRIQSEAGAYYRAEVSLVNTSKYNGRYFTVSGRADGVIKTDGTVTVDEIKSVRKYDFFAPPKEVHIAQLRCYAYFICCRDSLEEVNTRLTYFCTDTEKIRYYESRMSIDELRIYYYGLLSRVCARAELVIERTEKLLPEAADCAFPYSEMREGQETMIREAYSAIKHGKRLFAEAPTGTGKTVSALYPSVRALGKGLADKIFYLTAKASTRREAFAGAGKLFEGGAHLRTVVISAKEQVCKCAGRFANRDGKSLCNPVDCEFANGYYDRVENAIFDIVGRHSGYSRLAIEKTAEKYRICPYEFSLDLSELCDIVICDYNYVFDPCAYFRRYFADGNSEKSRYIFLVDEAHNLADRARDMYSAEIHSRDFEKIYSVIPESAGDINKIFEKIILYLRLLRKLCSDNIVRGADGNEQGFYMSSSPLPKLSSELETFRRKCDLWIRANADNSVCEEIHTLLTCVRRYITVGEYFEEDGRFRCYVQISGGDICVKEYCLDPSHIMNTILSRAVSSVMFSATLTPPEYFADVLGGGNKSVRLTLPSPFDRGRLCIAAVDYLSTRMEDREKNSARYATVIAAAVSPKPGNYIAYFPSYSCLESVYKAFVKKYPKVKTVVQSRGMGLREREEFLSEFREDEGKLRVGFCVLGGSFSEGVDLPGNRLIGTVIFGVGLPGLSSERNIIRDYYDETAECGYDYAYTFPGMNNVLQAAGRVIRSKDDRGVVVLVDDRYATPKYRELFPEHWKDMKYAGNAASLAEIVRRFWQKE